MKVALIYYKVVKILYSLFNVTAPFDSGLILFKWF